MLPQRPDTEASTGTCDVEASNAEGGKGLPQQPALHPLQDGNKAHAVETRHLAGGPALLPVVDSIVVPVKHATAEAPPGLSTPTASGTACEAQRGSKSGGHPWLNIKLIGVLQQIEAAATKPEANWSQGFRQLCPQPRPALSKLTPSPKGWWHCSPHTAPRTRPWWPWQPVHWAT